jgi:hypothetical protein
LSTSFFSKQGEQRKLGRKIPVIERGIISRLALTFVVEARQKAEGRRKEYLILLTFVEIPSFICAYLLKSGFGIRSYATEGLELILVKKTRTGLMKPAQQLVSQRLWFTDSGKLKQAKLN